MKYVKIDIPNRNTIKNMKMENNKKATFATILFVSMNSLMPTLGGAVENELNTWLSITQN
jgi:hypothetical protein